MPPRGGLPSTALGLNTDTYRVDGESRQGKKAVNTRRGLSRPSEQDDGSIKYIRQDDDGGLARQPTVLQDWHRQACLAARGERLELRALPFFTSSDVNLS